MTVANLREDWGEDDGPVLWWRFPIVEPPYCGSMLDDDFPDYVTHWTRLDIPDDPVLLAATRLDAARYRDLLPAILQILYLDPTRMDPSLRAARDKLGVAVWGRNKLDLMDNL